MPLRSLCVLMLPLSLAFAAEPVSQLDIQPFQDRVAQLTERAWKAPVYASIISESEFMDYLRKVSAEGETKVQQVHEERLAQRLHLLPEGMSMSVDGPGMAETMAKGANAVYDPPSDTFMLIRHPESTAVFSDRIASFHELVHAMDDQYWDLDHLIRQAGTLDETLVGGLLGEGSANLQTLRYAFQEQVAGHLDAQELDLLEHYSQPHSREFSAMPPMLQIRFLGLYTLGMAALVGDLDINSVWHDPHNIAKNHIDAMFAHPPQSTAEILHPEHVQPPVEMDLAPLAAQAGWDLVYETRVGELLTAFAFHPALPEGPAAFKTESWTHAAASGWMGDQFLSFARADQSEVDLWRTSWASRRDRDAFIAAWQQSFSDVAFVKVDKKTVIAYWGLNAQETALLEAFTPK